MADPLGASRRKIARAKEHIADLESETMLFFGAHSYSIVAGPDPNEPKHEVHRLRFSRPLPDSFANLTAESVHHLRTALDNFGYALAVSTGKVNPKYTAFLLVGGAVSIRGQH